MTLALRTRRFTADEYHRMGEVGILTRNDRVELIDGEIVEMSPIAPPHSRCVMFLTEVFVRRLAGRAVVSPQLSIRLSPHTEPQPDVMLLRPPLDRYARRIAQPSDALLVVEVADTSQIRDRQIKLPRYAAAGIPEYWIVDLDAAVVEVYRAPGPTSYTESRRLIRGEDLAPAAFLDVILAVGDILG